VLRIEIASESPTGIQLRLAGDISADHLPELERLLDDGAEKGRRVELDLGAVRLADREAVAFLAVGAGRDFALDRCPAFLREWIRREAEQKLDDPN
jgi:STAS domain-containing protein